MRSLLSIPKNHLWAAGTMAFSASFLLCGYEFARSSTTILFKAVYGPENLPLGMALIPLLIIVLLFLYGKTLSRLGPQKTLLTTSLAAGAVFVLGYVMIKNRIGPAALFLFPFKEAYIMVVLEQYWSFINSTITTESARKLNGPIIGVSTIGGVIGGALVHKLAIPWGTETLLLGTAFFMIPTALLAQIGYKKCGEPRPQKREEKKKSTLGLSHFQKTPLLRHLFFLVVATQIVATTLDISFQTILQEAYPSVDQQTSVSGKFFAVMNGTSVACQFILVPLFLKILPLGWIQRLLPTVHLVAIAAFLHSPSLKTAGLAFLLFKCLDYSFFRASKEIFYIPLPFDVRFRTKEVIDVFGYRFGKGGSSLVLLLLQRAGTPLFSLCSWTALGMTVVWHLLLFPLLRESRRLISSGAGFVSTHKSS